MAAEYQVRAYRVDLASLSAIVGCHDDALRAEVVKTAESLGLDEDSRVRNPDGIAGVVDEVIRGELDRKVPRGYRIALEAIADTTAQRLAFRAGDSGSLDLLTTYALREELGAVLVKLGAETLGRGWDTSALSWPWKDDGPKVDWPSASYWSFAQLVAATKELAAIKVTDSLVRGLVEDEFFADDIVEAVNVLVQLPALATKERPAKRRRCAGSAEDGLLILCDGEQ